MTARTEAFHILALAPLCGDARPSSARPVPCPDSEGLDRAVETLSPSLAIPVPRELCPEGFLTFTAASMRSFTPRGVVKACPYLDRFSRASDFAADEAGRGMTEGEIARAVRETWPDLPPDLTAASERPVRREPPGRDAVDDILSMVALPGSGEGRAPAGEGGTLKARMEGLLARLLKAVFDHEAFRLLEASWRGAETLVRQGPVRMDGPVRLDLCPVRAENLEDTLDTLKASLAPQPPGLVLVDLPFESTPPHVERLGRVADLAADLLVPTAVWAPARFFHIPSWGRFRTLPYLGHLLQDAAFAKWRRLREQPGAPWTAVLVNRFLARPAHGKDSPPRPVFFEEGGPLWIAPVWALGALAAQSTAQWGWPTRLTDTRRCSLRDLAVNPNGKDGPCSTEVLLSEDRTAELAESGLMPLTGQRGKDTAFMPRETTLTGGSMVFSLFMNRLLGHLFRLRSNGIETQGKAPSADEVSGALADLFRETGHEPPVDLSVRMEGGASEGAARMHVTLTPPASLLWGGEPVAFDLAWQEEADAS